MLSICNALDDVVFYLNQFVHFSDFDPGRITAHPKVIHYYKHIDPSLDKAAQEGVEELKAFIELRRNPEKYREYLQSL